MSHIPDFRWYKDEMVNSQQTNIPIQRQSKKEICYNGILIKGRDNFLELDFMKVIRTGNIWFNFIGGYGINHERRRYSVTLSLSGRPHTHNDSYIWNIFLHWPKSYFEQRTLQWRHYDYDGFSNHQPYDCLFTRLFRRRSKKTSKLRVTGLCVGNSPVAGELPAQMASNPENISIWWRHHDIAKRRLTSC